MSAEPDRTLYERIYEAVSRVPKGRVATYGDIAAMVGDCDARTVGYALNDLPKGRQAAVPWQRIINSQGGISTRSDAQRRLLEEEGVVFDARGRVSLARFRLPANDEPPEVEEAAQLRLF
jgi:methylated-DNA-protein-cysteine methyltransferase related protein